MRLMKRSEKEAALTVTHRPTERTERRKEGGKEENELIEKIVVKYTRTFSFNMSRGVRRCQNASQKCANTIVESCFSRGRLAITHEKEKTKIPKRTNRLTPSALNSYLWLRVQESGGNYEGRGGKVGEGAVNYP